MGDAQGNCRGGVIRGLIVPLPAPPDPDSLTLSASTSDSTGDVPQCSIYSRSACELLTFAHPISGENYPESRGICLNHTAKEVEGTEIREDHLLRALIPLALAWLP